MEQSNELERCGYVEKCKLTHEYPDEPPRSAIIAGRAVLMADVSSLVSSVKQYAHLTIVWSIAAKNTVNMSLNDSVRSHATSAPPHEKNVPRENKLQITMRICIRQSLRCIN